MAGDGSRASAEASSSSRCWKLREEEVACLFSGAEDEVWICLGWVREGGWGAGGRRWVG